MLFDDQISREEWYMMWEDYAKNPDNPPEWQNVYMNFVFDLEDTSGNYYFHFNYCYMAKFDFCF